MNEYRNAPVVSTPQVLLPRACELGGRRTNPRKARVESHYLCSFITRVAYPEQSATSCRSAWRFYLVRSVRHRHDLC